MIFFLTQRKQRRDTERTDILLLCFCVLCVLCVLCVSSLFSLCFFLRNISYLRSCFMSGNPPQDFLPHRTHSSDRIHSYVTYVTYVFYVVKKNMVKKIIPAIYIYL